MLGQVRMFWHARVSFRMGHFAESAGYISPLTLLSRCADELILVDSSVAYVRMMQCDEKRRAECGTQLKNILADDWVEMTVREACLLFKDVDDVPLLSFRLKRSLGRRL